VGSGTIIEPGFAIYHYPDDINVGLSSVRNLQINKGQSPKPFTFSNSHISNNITDGLTGLLLNGKILNSPLTFCDDDMFLIDSARGYGSDEYGTEFRVVGGIDNTGDLNDAEYGHPSYNINCTIDDDCVGIGNGTCSSPYCDVDSGFYYSTLTEYDG
jgi:hypothetical protein